jgi:thiamine-phosphate pyrophosphorylase
MLLYYITDRKQFPGNESSRQQRLLEKIAEAANAGVDCIQLREKDLPPRELEQLAREAAQAIKSTPLRNSRPTKLLINSRTDIALAAECDGIHLRSDDLSASDARNIWQAAWSKQKKLFPTIAVSCHSLDEITRAAKHQPSFVVFGPVYEKSDGAATAPTGLDALRQACRQGVPVLALGGITLENALECMKAGAAGVAAIRLFQENNIAEIVHQLHSQLRS